MSFRIPSRGATRAVERGIDGLCSLPSVSARTWATDRTKQPAEREAATTEEPELKWHKYTAYGLGIHSELPLPELMTGSEAKCDVVIRLRRIAHRLGDADRTYTYFQVAADEAFLRWDSVGTFLARSGREIVVEPAPGAGEQDVRRVLESVVLGAIAHQRGMLALHATAVMIHGEAVAFLAAKREGRFAIAAALHARGHALLADDLLVLAGSSTERVSVLPGFSQLRLRPSARVTGAPHGRSPDHDRGSFPLHCLYVLKRGTSLARGTLSRREALVSVIRDSYAARMFPQSLWGVKASAHFVRCAALVDSVPIYRLEQPASLAVLPSSVRMVEDQLVGSPQGAASPVDRRVTT